MATCIHSSRSCLPPFYTIPILIERFFIYLSPFVFAAQCILNVCSEQYIAWGYLLLFTHLLCLCRVVRIVLCMYANFHCYNCQCGPVIRIIHFKERLPKAICCCLQTCSVNVVLMIMCCMFIPAFIVTSANISQLWVYLC